MIFVEFASLNFIRLLLGHGVRSMLCLNSGTSSPRLSGVSGLKPLIDMFISDSNSLQLEPSILFDSLFCRSIFVGAVFVLILELSSRERPAGIFSLHTMLLMLFGVMMVFAVPNLRVVGSVNFCNVVHVSFCGCCVDEVLVLAGHKFKPFFLLGCDLSTHVPDHIQSWWRIWYFGDGGAVRMSLKSILVLSKVLKLVSSFSDCSTSRNFIAQSSSSMLMYKLEVSHQRLWSNCEELNIVSDLWVRTGISQNFLSFWLDLFSLPLQIISSRENILFMLKIIEQNNKNYHKFIFFSITSNCFSFLLSAKLLFLFFLFFEHKCCFKYFSAGGLRKPGTKGEENLVKEKHFWFFPSVFFISKREEGTFWFLLCVFFRSQCSAKLFFFGSCKKSEFN